MPETPLPTLDQDLTEGHCLDCLEVNLDAFADVEEMVQETISETLEAINTWVLDKDLDFASTAADSLDTRDYYNNQMGLVLRKLSNFQRRIKGSNLKEEEKQLLWAPIAECYAQVTALLSERITPLEEREEWAPGDTKEVEVQIHPIPTGTRVLASTALGQFQYSSPIRKRREAGGGTYLKALEYIDFPQGHCQKISSLTAILLGNKDRLTIKVRVKLVSFDHGMIPIGEVDKQHLEELVAAQGA